MAAHFKVLVHPNGNSVYLNPMGTFDPGSARELTDVIKRFQDRGKRIFVHTNGISTVDAAGQAEYLRRIAAMNPGAQSVIVTGEKKFVLGGNGKEASRDSSSFRPALKQKKKDFLRCPGGGRDSGLRDCVAIRHPGGGRDPEVHHRVSFS